MDAQGPIVEAARVDATGISHHAPGASRVAGALAAAGISALIGLAGFGLGSSVDPGYGILLMASVIGILPAGALGAVLGPDGGRPGHELASVTAMAVGTVVLADSMIVALWLVPLLPAVTSLDPPTDASAILVPGNPIAEVLSWIVFALLAWVAGLVIVGLPALMLTIPAATVWVAVMRWLAHRFDW